MIKHIHRTVLAGFMILAAAAPPASAQWAVVDAPAIAQLIQEVQTMQQQLQVAQAQLLEAKQALQSMTGDRGMEQLLSGTSRNYLPSSWTQLASASHLHRRHGNCRCYESLFHRCDSGRRAGGTEQSVFSHPL